MEKKTYNGGATPMVDITVDVTQEFVDQELEKAVKKYQNNEELDYMERQLINQWFGIQKGKYDKVTPYTYCFIRDM